MQDTTTTDTEREILDVALELHDQAEAQRAVSGRRRALREAAAELGIAPAHLEAAEAIVMRRRASPPARPVPPPKPRGSALTSATRIFGLVGSIMFALTMIGLAIAAGGIASCAGRFIRL